MSLATVQKTLQNRFVGHSRSRSEVTLVLDSLQLYSSQQRFLIELGLKAKHKRYSTSFNIFVWALPQLVDDKLRLTDVRLGTASESFVTTQLLWLARSFLLQDLVAEVERKSVYDLSDLISKAKRNANESLQNLLIGLPQRSTLTGELSSLSIENINISDGRLWFTLLARSRLQGELVLDKI